MQPYVLAFNGSPRKGGNTELLLASAIEGVKKTGASVETVAVNGLDFLPCQNCGYCTRHGVCRLADKDDMGKVYESMERATHFLAASPVYFASVSAQLKALIDRCQSYWARKFVLKKESPNPKRNGILLGVGGFAHRGFWPCMQKVVRAWYICCDVKYLGGLFYHGIDAMGDIGKHPTALQEAYDAGMRLVSGKGPDPAAVGAEK